MNEPVYCYDCYGGRMKCTCKVSDVKTYGDAIQIMIDYYPKHAMMDELIAALKENKEILTALAIVVDKLRDTTIAALAKAEPQP